MSKRDLRAELRNAKANRGLTWAGVAREVGYTRPTLRKFLDGSKINLQTFLPDIEAWIDDDPIITIQDTEKELERLRTENFRMKAILEVYGFGSNGLTIPECRNCARLTDRIELLVRENERLNPHQLRLCEAK